MVFSSIPFLFYFLPVFLLAYMLVSRQELRNALLLLFSLVFYAWGEPAFILVLLTSIAFNHLFALLIDSTAHALKRIILMASGIACNLLLLAVFKYYDFFIGNIALILSPDLVSALPALDIPLPLGISFFTFQALTYLVDVYRHEVRAEKNPFYVALYISMFPQLIAGPIVRFRTVRYQLHHRHISTWRVSAGTRIFVIGLAQKVLVANEVGPLADAAFGTGGTPGALVAWLGITAYTLQIYFDFAGYSNMAIGLGLMLGFKFPRNFNFPYVATSVTEFWRRWHISLSRWFRDYLYIPLGGNRVSPARTWFNLLLVFLLCGLWHGAAWTFVIWGLYHGFFLVLERAGLASILDSLYRPFRHLYLLLVVMSAWVWFRAENLDQALMFFQSLAGVHGFFTGYEDIVYHIHPVSIGMLLLGSFFALRPLTREWLPSQTEAHWKESKLSLKALLGWGGVMATFLLSLASVISSTYNPFLYFRF